MQKTKGLIVLSFVLIIICVALGVLFVILANLLSSKTEIPISYPTSYTNTIRIVSKDLEKYIYATISKEDTIVLKDIAGEKRVISLENNNWKDIQFSPDYTLVSVLGKSKEGQYNLFLYNLSTERFEQVTSYSDYGVESYIWLNNDEIVFTQGASDQKWLHSYKYSSKSQVIKLSLVRGDLIRVSENKKILIFKENSEFILRDSNGKLIISSSDINLDIQIKDILTLSDPAIVLIQDSQDNLYSYDLIEETLSEPLKLNSVPILMCSVSKNFRLYTIESNQLNILIGDSQDLSLKQDDTNFTLEDSSTISIEKCTSETYLLKVSGTKTKWFNNSKIFAEVPVLEEDFDADVKITK